MTEIELSERIEALLTENPVQQKAGQGHKSYSREMQVRKEDRLLQIISQSYRPHAGYVDWDFSGPTLLRSGKYIKYPKNSSCQRWMKRLTSKKARHCPELKDKGNRYRRLFDFWWTLY